MFSAYEVLMDSEVRLRSTCLRCSSPARADPLRAFSPRPPAFPSHRSDKSTTTMERTDSSNVRIKVATTRETSSRASLAEEEGRFSTGAL